MAITRSQMPRQLEPGLGNSWKGKYKKATKAVHEKKAKSNRKKPK